jgi:hypothetical protein
MNDENQRWHTVLHHHPNARRLTRLVRRLKATTSRCAAQQDHCLRLAQQQQNPKKDHRHKEV